ncbi:MAG: lipoate--protein ligase family protein [Acidimicrobiia bacterium]|nr:lipoate--protein ligase family protein [Acidimicrobiia bacterium]MXX46352.1 lipoate--protein ligase family protein [Acidimicrobiia bacterium]MYB78124.1 lipoate--protein ligase family protein [Acidimicrobiia bacterium]MYD41805.1 lipoate--protein ligase family protein [Acidimicrobiia bacterium]
MGYRIDGGPRRIAVVRAANPDNPALDTAISHAFLEEVAAGLRGETFRLYVPGRVVAFGRQDTTAAGYPEAVRACRMGGYEAVERLAGGRAAVFNEGTLAFSWAIPSSDPVRRIGLRFAEIDRIVVGALSSLGFDARVGEVKGEYCPGRYSVNLSGRWKVMGVGQRLRRGVAHVGGVVAVSGRADINRVLTPVYRALAFDWDRNATGSLRAARPETTMAEVADAFLRQLALFGETSEEQLGTDSLRRANELLPQHIPAPSPGRS